MTQPEILEQITKLRVELRKHYKALVDEALKKYDDESQTDVDYNTSPGKYKPFANKLNQIARDLLSKDRDVFEKLKTVNDVPADEDEETTASENGDEVTSASEKENEATAAATNEDEITQLLPKKYRITANQLRDAHQKKVQWALKSHVYETLHYYLYGKFSKDRKLAPDQQNIQLNYGNLLQQIEDYEKEIEDLKNKLIKAEDQTLDVNRQFVDAQDRVEDLKRHLTAHESQAAVLNQQLTKSQNQVAELRKRNETTWVIGTILGIAFIVFAFQLVSANREAAIAKTGFDSTSNQLATLKRDMRILPYQPTPAQIARLEGVYMIYTASPQARKSDPDRYHKVVPNILVVNYKKEGYFTFNRHGHDFDQEGYMQFEDSNLVSMHSYMIGDYGKRSPKKTLIPFENSKDTFSVISSSWSFDPNAANNISIGIREVFIKIGKPGSITQIVNSPRNFGKAGKLFDLKKENGEIETIYIENIRLETLPPSVQPLLNEKSILLNDPDPTVILEKQIRN